MQLYVLDKVSYIGLAWYEFMIIFSLLVVGYVMFFVYMLRINRYAPEAKIYAYARQKRVDIVRIFDNDDHEELYPAIVQKQGEPIYKERAGYGLQLVPAMQGKSLTSRTKDGIAVHNFSVNFPFSIAPKNAMAIKTVIEYVRNNKEYDTLSFLPDIALMTLIGTSRDDLDDDIKTYVDLYDPTINADEFITMIKKIQDELGTTHIKQGEFSFRLAFENITAAFTAQDLHQVKQLIERIMREKVLNEDRQLKLLIYGGVAFSAVMISGALAFYIIK